MSDERWIVIPRWDEFQHRDMARSTVPPWIKNHTKLLHDDAYLELSDHQRAVLHGLWLAYAAARRQLSGSTASLSRHLALRVTTRTLETLNHAGFIELSASRPARSIDSNPAGLEVEVEKEKKFLKGQRSKPTTPIARIRAMIQNGAIVDEVTLDAELRANGLNGDDEAALKTELATVTGQPVEPFPEDAGPPDPDDWSSE